MEKLKVGEVAVLEDEKEYIVFFETMYKDTEYLYLISKFKPVEIRYATQEMQDGELILKFVTEKEEKENLLKLFEEKNQ